jgi:hypothetical protein
MEMQERARIWGRLVAKSWEDDAFKQRLMANPIAVLKEYGVEVRPGVEVKVVEGRAAPEFGENAVVLSIPPKPSAEELSEEELGLAAGGYWGCSCVDTKAGPLRPKG